MLNINNKKIIIFISLIAIGLLLGTIVGIGIIKLREKNFDEEYFHKDDEVEIYVHLKRNNKCEFRYYDKFDDENNCTYKITKKEDGFITGIDLILKDNKVTYKCTRRYGVYNDERGTFNTLYCNLDNDLDFDFTVATKGSK